MHPISLKHVGEKGRQEVRTHMAMLQCQCSEPDSQGGGSDTGAWTQPSLTSL